MVILPKSNIHCLENYCQNRQSTAENDRPFQKISKIVYFLLQSIINLGGPDNCSVCPVGNKSLVALVHGIFLQADLRPRSHEMNLSATYDTRMLQAISRRRNFTYSMSSQHVVSKFVSCLLGVWPVLSSLKSLIFFQHKK